MIYGVTVAVNFLARKLAVKAFKGAVAANVISLVLMIAVEQAIRYAPKIKFDMKQLHYVLENIPTKPPEEVITLNEAQVDYKRGRPLDDLAPKSVFAVKLHEQHRLPRRFKTFNLDNKKYKSISRKSAASSIAGDIAYDSYYDVHCRVAHNDNGFAKGLIYEISRAPPVVKIG